VFIGKTEFTLKLLEERRNIFVNLTTITNNVKATRTPAAASSLTDVVTSDASEQISSGGNFTDDFDIIYFYTEFQERFLQFQEEEEQRSTSTVTFIDNFDTLITLTDSGEGDPEGGRGRGPSKRKKLVVLDDALLDLKGKDLDRVTTFFIKKCHHKQV